jgi:hypothetical protein
MIAWIEPCLGQQFDGGALHEVNGLHKSISVTTSRDILLRIKARWRGGAFREENGLHESISVTTSRDVLLRIIGRISER